MRLAQARREEEERQRLEAAARTKKMAEDLAAAEALPKPIVFCVIRRTSNREVIKAEFQEEVHDDYEGRPLHQYVYRVNMFLKTHHVTFEMCVNIIPGPPEIHVRSLFGWNQDLRAKSNEITLECVDIACDRFKTTGDDQEWVLKFMYLREAQRRCIQLRGELVGESILQPELIKDCMSDRCPICLESCVLGFKWWELVSPDADSTIVSDHGRNSGSKYLSDVVHNETMSARSTRGLYTLEDQFLMKDEQGEPIDLVRGDVVKSKGKFFLPIFDGSCIRAECSCRALFHPHCFMKLEKSPDFRSRCPNCRQEITDSYAISIREKIPEDEQESVISEATPRDSFYSNA